MEKIKRLLDDVKVAKGITTDYALAKALDLPRPRIHDYYKGKTTPDVFACLKIAEALGKPLDVIVAIVEIDAEKNDKRREAWLAYSKRFGGLAAAIMLWVFGTMLGVTLFVTRPAEAAQKQEVSKSEFYNLQIMRGRDTNRKRCTPPHLPKRCAPTQACIPMTQPR